MRTIVISAVLAAVAALALGAGSASAKSCGAAVINDWYVDGTIDKQYPAQCYREALTRVPEQAKIYSDLPEQLDRGSGPRSRAMACSARRRRSPARPARPRGIAGRSSASSASSALTRRIRFRFRS